MQEVQTLTGQIINELEAEQMRKEELNYSGSIEHENKVYTYQPLFDEFNNINQVVISPEPQTQHEKYQIVEKVFAQISKRNKDLLN